MSYVDVVNAVTHVVRDYPVGTVFVRSTPDDEVSDKFTMLVVRTDDGEGWFAMKFDGSEAFTGREYPHAGRLLLNSSWHVIVP